MNCFYKAFPRDANQHSRPRNVNVRSAPNAWSTAGTSVCGQKSIPSADEDGRAVAAAAAASACGRSPRPFTAAPAAAPAAEPAAARQRAQPPAVFRVRLCSRLAQFLAQFLLTCSSLYDAFCSRLGRESGHRFYDDEPCYLGNTPGPCDSANTPAITFRPWLMNATQAVLSKKLGKPGLLYVGAALWGKAANGAGITLKPTWKAEWAVLAATARPLLANGSIFGFNLGDELVPSPGQKTCHPHPSIYPFNLPLCWGLLVPYLSPE